MADSNPVIRASKRKRHQVSYLADDYFESLDIEGAEEEALVGSDKDESDNLDSDELDGSFIGHTEGKPLKKKQKVKAVPKVKRAKAVKPFRFMDLPAELRDEIYRFALKEPSGITLVTRTKDLCRIVERGVIAIDEGKNYSGKAQPAYRGYWSNLMRTGASSSLIGTGRQARLSPNLCAVSTQMREEGSSILYKQEIILEDTTALHVFITTIGSFNRQLLANVTVKGWAMRRSTKGNNFAAFAAMTECINLQTLFLDCSVDYRTSPDAVARQIFKAAHPFLKAHGFANGSYDAAVDVLEMSDFHFMEQAADDSGLVFSEKKHVEFETTLRSHLQRTRRG